MALSIDLEVGSTAVVGLDQRASMMCFGHDRVFRWEDGPEYNRPLELWLLRIAIAFMIQTTCYLQTVSKVKEGAPVLIDSTFVGHSARSSVDTDRVGWTR